MWRYAKHYFSLGSEKEKKTNYLVYVGSSLMFSLQIGAFHTLEIELHRPFVLRKVCLLMLGWAALTFFKIYGCFGILQLIFFPTIYEGKTAISFVVLHVICLLTSNLSVFSSFSSLHYYWMSDVQMSYDHIKFCNVGFSSFMLSYMLFAV